MVYHVPALLDKTIEGLNIKPSGIYVDVTFGGGGHSKEILKQLGPSGKLIAFDQDDDAIVNVPDDDRLLFLNQNFRFLKNNLKFNSIDHIDGLLADLGVSFYQFDEADRGFSFRQDSRLDMRMNKRGGKDAATLLNTMEEGELANLLFQYGELPNARQLAKCIVNARAEKPVETTGQLIAVIEKFAQRGKENKFYAKVFQALRIVVNGEMTALKEMLTQAYEMLGVGGRLVVITYHSLEDRLVKNFMKTGNFEGVENKDFYGNVERQFVLVNKKGTTPDETEVEINNRARSARLRIAEKIK